MQKHKYRVILTDGEFEEGYHEWAFTEKEAITLAKAEATKNGHGIDFVLVEVMI